MEMKSTRGKPPASRIYAEIRQGKPFRRPEPELAVVLLRTGDVLHHSLSRALAPQGVSHEQYNALRILRGAAEEGHPTLEISRRLVSRSPNITRLVDKLVAKGLARRDRNADDRRQAVVRITPAGLKVTAEGDRAIESVLAKLRRLSAAEMKAAVGLLDRIREAVAVTTVQESLRSEDS